MKLKLPCIAAMFVGACTSTTDTTPTDDAHPFDSAFETGLFPADLVAKLGDSVWVGTVTRNGAEVSVEQHFRASERLWGELVDPWGLRRHREMRQVTFDINGVSARTVVTQPTGWPVNPEVGREDTWQIEIVGGEPRTLNLTRDGVTETYTEGSLAPPTEGFVATVRNFLPGTTADLAMCVGAEFGFDYRAVLGFARGTSALPITTERVVGVPIGTWTPPTDGEVWSVRDLPGFADTSITTDGYFAVQYAGLITVGEGAVSMREVGDNPTDAVWALVGPAAFQETTGRSLLFESHTREWAEATPAVGSITTEAGEFGLEVVLSRCGGPIEGLDLEMRVPGRPWRPIDRADIRPYFDPTAFPPVFSPTP